MRFAIGCADVLENNLLAERAVKELPLGNCNFSSRVWPSLGRQTNKQQTMVEPRATHGR
jgi:hypothetical protein